MYASNTIDIFQRFVVVSRKTFLPARTRVRLTPPVPVSALKICHPPARRHVVPRAKTRGLHTSNPDALPFHIDDHFV